MQKERLKSKTPMMDRVADLLYSFEHGTARAPSIIYMSAAVKDTLIYESSMLSEPGPCWGSSCEGTGKFMGVPVIVRELVSPDYIEVK